MKRRMLSLVALILLMTSSLIMPAAAAEEAPTISPRYVNIMAFSASIGVNSSGKASCYSFVETANTSYNINLSVSLQRYINGGWSTVKNWSTSGTGETSLYKSWYVTSGYYYRTAATATVRTSGGSLVEIVTIYSQSDYY